MEVDDTLVRETMGHMRSMYPACTPQRPVRPTSGDGIPTGPIPPYPGWLRPVFRSVYLGLWVSSRVGFVASQAEYAGSIPVIGSVLPQFTAISGLHKPTWAAILDRPLTVAQRETQPTIVCWSIGAGWT